MTAERPKIAFYGLGAMGGGMAANLVKEGYHITGYDVFEPLVQKFASTGGHASTSGQSAAKGSSIVIVMVATMQQTNSLLFSGEQPAVDGIEKNAILILCSTCPPSYPPQLRALLDEHSRTDIQLLDCPVSGGTIRAAAGTLSIFASGPPETLRAADAVLHSMSANLYTIPGGISGGQKTKAIHQLMAATNIISASEAMGLAATAGLDTAAVYDHVSANSGSSFMFENRVPHMLADDWSPLSALGIIWKDALIVADAAKEARHPVPLCAAAEQLYCLANARGLLKDDDAKLVTMYLPLTQSSAVAQLKGSDGGSITAAASKAGIDKDTVNDLLAGIHLAASIEAMALCEALGMDTKTMYEIISKAAGWARVFETYIPGMLERGEWTLAACCSGSGGAEDVVSRFRTAVEKARAIGYPAQMGTTALNLVDFATIWS